MGSHDVVDQFEPVGGQADDDLASIVGGCSGDQSAGFEAVDSVDDRARGDHRVVDEVTGGEFVRGAGAPKGGEDVYIQFSMPKIAIGCAAAIGVALVVIHPGAGIDPVGILVAVAATVSFALGAVLTKRFPEPADRLASTGWQLLMGGVGLVPLGLLVEGPPPVLTPRNVIGFAYLSLVTTALAFVLWFNGIRRLPTPAPPLLGLAAPVTGVALGWTVLGQSLSSVQLVGLAVTLLAIAYGSTLGSVSERSIRTNRPVPAQ